TSCAGTAHAATQKESRSADWVSGSASASKNTPTPRLNASKNTRSKGAIRMTARKASATPITAARVSGPSPTGVWRRLRITVSGMSEPFPAPRLKHVDDKEHAERDQQHDRRDGGRGGVPGRPALFKADNDQQRRNLGDVRQVARDEDHRTVFADATRERQGE